MRTYAEHLGIQRVDVPNAELLVPAWTSNFIMIQAGDVFDMRLGDVLLRGHRVMAVGPMTRPTCFANPPVSVRGIAVLLHPGVLARILEGETVVDSTHDLADRLPELEPLPPDCDDDTLVERATIIVEALTERGVRRPPASSALFDRARSVIDHGPRALSVAEIAESLEVSTVALRKAFHANVGLAPKLFLRIRRIEQVLQDFHANPDIEKLAKIAGFADQSHLIREFRTFCGITPTEFLGRLHAPDVREVHNNLA